jgi:hypothetical protein
MAETNRVLNFSEFGKKYSQEAAQDTAASYSEFAKSADNFQEGFDEDTYEEGQSGPKRPIETASSETPALPGEEGAPSFSSNAPEGMEAPEDTESEEEEKVELSDDEKESLETSVDQPKESDDDWEDYGNPEDEEDEEEEEDEDTNESVNRAFVLESFDEFTIAQSQPRSNYSDIIDTIEFEDFDDNQEEEDSEHCMVRCKACGAQKEIGSEEYPFGADNESNPDSWWQGSTMGMNCGCNM